MDHIGSPFPLRGVVEGFYGTYYTFPERDDLIRFIGDNGFNFYLYGPKGDRQHRARWWEPYPPRVLDDFARTIATAYGAGVTFCYAISFGVPLGSNAEEQLRLVTTKLRAFFDRGCRSFAVFLDDLPTSFTLTAEGRDFRSLATADAQFCNRLHEWARSLDDACRLFVCPTEYHGRPPFSSYLHDLGRDLDAGIDLLYTGPAVCSTEIRVSDVLDFADAAGRYPVIWDNYPVNDCEMRFEMHLGSLRGRDPQLHRVTRGFISNLMNQAEASKIPLLTIAEYLHDPHAYDPEAAWDRALLAIAGEESAPPLRLFAENSLGSCLQDLDAPLMDRLASATLTSFMQGENVVCSTAAEALSDYLTLADESLYHLKYRSSNVALRRDLLNWVQALDDKVWMGRAALRLLWEIEREMDRVAPVKALEELMDTVGRNPQRVGGTALLALAKYALERAGSLVAPPLAAE